MRSDEKESSPGFDTWTVFLLLTQKANRTGYWGGGEVHSITLPVCRSEIHARGICAQNINPSQLLLFSLCWLLRKLHVTQPARTHSSLSSASLKVTFKDTAKISELLLHNSSLCVYLYSLT